MVGQLAAAKGAKSVGQTVAHSVETLAAQLAATLVAYLALTSAGWTAKKRVDPLDRMLVARKAEM
jgi:hypothetical protein